MLLSSDLWSVGLAFYQMLTGDKELTINGKLIRELLSKRKGVRKVLDTIKKRIALRFENKHDSFSHVKPKDRARYLKKRITAPPLSHQTVAPRMV